MNKVTLRGAWIEKLEIEDYRSVKSLSLEFQPDTQCIVLIGPNGGGKSVILEAALNGLTDCLADFYIIAPCHVYECLYRESGKYMVWFFRIKEYHPDFANRVHGVISQFVGFDWDGEYISRYGSGAGYKILMWLCLMKYFYREEMVDPSEMEGVILVDDIELHLDAEMQSEILKRICVAFPKIQFIITTHATKVSRNAPGGTEFYRVTKGDNGTNAEQYEKYKSFNRLRRISSRGNRV